MALPDLTHEMRPPLKESPGAANAKPAGGRDTTVKRRRHTGEQRSR